jgi:hypothetical protein
MSHAKNSNKDVIYIDVEDEITGIIDKLQASSHHIVALVLPKRATVFQSVVNMKLLKSAAEKAKKNVVLITSEASLMPLAGSVGVHVAKSLQSKPEVPDAPEKLDDKADAIDEVGDEDPPLDKAKSVGELSGDEDEAIELDDEESEKDTPLVGKMPKGKNKKLKIPNFNRFRLILLLGGAGLVALIVFGFLAFSVLPKAHVRITTDSSALNVSQDVTFKTGDNVTLDLAQGIVPATNQEAKKTLSQTVPATGQQNNGEKATGSVDMTAQDCSAPYSVAAVAAGTGLTANGKTYITGEKANFSPTTFNFSTSCWSYKADGVDITAQTGGAAFNTGSTAFTVAGRSDVAATGSASGGTDSIIKVISQADIDGAKQKISEQDAAAVKLELMQGLQSKSLYPIESTFNTAAPTSKQSANVGDQAETVTVTQDVVYTMLGVNRDDMEKLIAESVKDEIDPTKQGILDYGLADAVFTAFAPKPEGTTAGMQVTVIAGPELDAEDIKKQVAGKKASDAEELIKENPGVTEVQVKYSPFWVSSIPKKTSKITVVIEKPEVSSDDAQTSDQ